MEGDDIRMKMKEDERKEVKGGKFKCTLLVLD